jgi:hypothetical protein
MVGDVEFQIVCSKQRADASISFIFVCVCVCFCVCVCVFLCVCVCVCNIYTHNTHRHTQYVTHTAHTHTHTHTHTHRRFFFVSSFCEGARSHPHSRSHEEQTSCLFGRGLRCAVLDFEQGTIQISGCHALLR